MIKLFIILFSTSSYSNYVKRSDFSTGVFKTHTKEADCGSDCVQIDKNFNSNYYQLNSQGNVVINNQAKSDYDIAKAAADMELAIKNIIKKNISYGKELIIDLNYRLSSKELSAQQVIEIDTKMSKVKSLLESGSINTAFSLISSMSVDSVFTQEDKDFFIGKVNSYLGK